MEFDQLDIKVKFPLDIKINDILLIGNCGAYDMSMQYHFGDGKARDFLFLKN